MKAKGNAAFQAGNYDEAATLFSEAIVLKPDNHILYSNRSGAYVSLGRLEEAVQDAHQSTVLKPDYMRGYKRKGLALFKMGKYKEAVEAYETGLKLDPANQELQLDLAEARKMMAGPGMGGMGGMGGNNQFYN